MIYKPTFKHIRIKLYTYTRVRRCFRRIVSDQVLYTVGKSNYYYNRRDFFPHFLQRSPSNNKTQLYTHHFHTESITSVETVSQGGKNIIIQPSPKTHIIDKSWSVSNKWKGETPAGGWFTMSKLKKKRKKICTTSL